MPFLYQPPIILIRTQEVFPDNIRRWMLRLWWGSALAVFVVAALGLSTLIGLSFMIAGIALFLSFAILYLEHGAGLPLWRTTLYDALLQGKKGETVNLATWCIPEVLAALGSRTTFSHALHGLFLQYDTQRIVARLALPAGEVAIAVRNTVAQKRSLQKERAEFLAAVTEAATHAARTGHHEIMLNDVLVAFVEHSVLLKQLLFDHSLTVEDFDIVAHSENRRFREERERRAFWSRENLFSIRPFAKSWAFGYTPTLDHFSIEFSREGLSWRNDIRVLGRLHEIRALERTLTKGASTNGLLVIEPGVGGEDVLRGFVARVRNGASLPFLNYRRIAIVDFGAAIAGLATPGEIEGRVRQLLSEAARAGGMILVVENFPALLNADQIGVDLSATFLPLLQGTKIQLVATTTPKALHEVIEKRESLSALFERIEVHEPDITTTMQIALDMIPTLEQRFRIFVPYPSLKSLVTYADRTIQDVPFPRKAVDLLDDALIAAQNAKEEVLTPDRVAAVVSEHTEIPVGALTREERQRLLHLEAFIHERIVDQEEAVHVLADALRRARSGIVAGSTKRPIGTFLFMGPTGVGKTETAKALAESYYGNEDRIVRLDMSEFQGNDAIDRLIGSPATHEEGRLTTAIRESPFSLLLLDEFEKAHAKALDLFLQIFDEGRMKDGWGRTIAFSNTLIIATSNAGAEFIRQYLKEGRSQENLSDALREEVLREGLFRLELVNRFDGVIVFRPLGIQEVHEIGRRLITRLAKNIEREQGVRLQVNDEALTHLVEEGFNQEFGARELRRVLQDSVENLVAKRVIAGTLRRGDTCEVTLQDITVEEAA